MATRIVKYIPKNTAAGTDYREIEEDDKAFVLQQCIKALTIMAEYDRASSKNTDDCWIRDQWWHKKSTGLNKGRDGLNSPCSVLGGIVNNMMFKTPAQRDFSDKQMRDLENIFNGMAHFCPDIQAVRFQIGFGE